MSANQIFIVFYVLLFFYFARRRFDLFSYVFLSSSVYFMPAVFGFVHDASMPLQLIPITPGLYYFYYFFYLVLIVFSISAKPVTKTNRTIAIPENTGSQINPTSVKVLRYLRVARWLSLIFLVIGFFSMKDVFFTENKQDFLDGQSLFFSIWQSISLLYVLLAVWLRRKLDILIGALYCVLDLYIGFRGVAVFSLLSIFLLYAYKNQRDKFLFMKIVSYGALAYIVLAIYKSMIWFVKANDIDAGLENFGDSESIYGMLLLSESFTQQAIFNAILVNNFTVPAEHVFSFLRVFLPGFGELVFDKQAGFNSYFQPVLFSHIPWGMANNFWAEQYALFGAVWLGVVTVCFFLIIRWANRKMLKYAVSNSDRLCFAVFLAVPAIFFIHRNSFEFELYIVRNSIFVLLFIALLSKIRVKI